MLVSFKYPDHKDTQKSLGLMLDLPKNFSKNEVGLSGRIHDLKSEFVFEVFHQLKDDSRLDGEYIFKNTIFQTTHDIEVGNFFKINGYFQGSGFRKLDNGKNIYSIYCDNEILDFEVNNNNKHPESTIFPQSPSQPSEQDSVSSTLNYALSPEKQHQIIEKSFKNYKSDPTERGLIKKMIPQLSQEIIEEKINQMTFNILDRNSSDMHIAVNNISNSRFSLEDIGNSRKNSEDMITFELEKKFKKLQQWVDFLNDCSLLNMIGRECRCFLLQSIEKITSILRIRELQRELKSDEKLKKFAESAFKKYFSIFLQDFDKELKFQKSNEGGMEEETNNDNFEHENPNKFFFYVSKHYKLINKTIGYFLNLRGTFSDKIEKNHLVVISRLIIKILTKVQQTRALFQQKLNLNSLKKNWWLHESSLTYGKSGLVAFYNVLSKRFYHFKQIEEEKDTDFSGLINSLSKCLLRELNVDYLNRKNSSILDSNKFVGKEFSQFASSAMNLLIMNKQTEDVLKLAEGLNSFEYVCQLFVVDGYDVPIKKFIRKWGDDFLGYFVRYSLMYLEKIGKKNGDEARYYDLDKCKRPLYFLNNLEEFNSEILKIVREEYPGLSWLLVFEEHGVSAGLKEIKNLRKNELARASISDEGMEMIGMMGDIMEAVI